MDDKDIPVEGQEETPPVTEEAPEVVDEETSPSNEDTEMTEWATNKGYSEDDLKDEKVQKAIKMAYNAEKFVGKSKEQAEEPDVDIDKMIDEILGNPQKPEAKATDMLKGIDSSKLSPEEKAAFDAIIAEAKRQAQEEARAIVAPYESELRKRTYRQELDSLHKEFGDDVLKKAPAILRKVASGSPLRDAVVSTLSESLLKKARIEGIKQGKEIKKEEISQKTEAVRKTDVKTLSEEWDTLTLDEQERILKELQSKG